MSKKVFIKTFGCQMNEYDSQKMADVLGAAEGYEETQDPDEADLVLFNTCSVREKAQEKVFSDLGRVKLGQTVSVFIDSQPGRAFSGRLSFISSEAEFTPKTVQTEKERTSLVYRIKVDLDNASQVFKPGMPVTVQFSDEEGAR